MSLYATGLNQPARPGCCVFVFHWEDVDMHCPDRAIPGGDECADHLIARVHIGILPTVGEWASR